MINIICSKLAIAEFINDAKMWTDANRQLYVIMTAKEVK